MFKYRSSINIRIIFLLLIVITASLFFIINRKITNQFRTEHNLGAMNDMTIQEREEIVRLEKSILASPCTFPFLSKK